MNILFTGASSCTGMHFVLALLRKGHTVTCTFTKRHHDYDGVKKKRIEQIISQITPIWNTSFGDKNFCTLVEKGRFSTYAHHMAWTKGYGTKDYNISKAIQNNTNNLELVVQLLKKNGCTQIILTRSVFEGDHVLCQGGSTPFEPHGNAKKQTSLLFLQQSSIIPIRQFIIPNPVGTFDQVRLVEYLHSCWKKQKTPQIHYPKNIRDNIPIPLLQRRYTGFLKESSSWTSPSGWIYSNKDWIEKVARELKKRFHYQTPCVYGPQRDNNQPLQLYNTEPMIAPWDEQAFWDRLAQHYRQRFRD